MGGVKRAAFVVLQDLPAVEIILQLARAQAVRGGFFTGRGRVSDGEKDPAGRDASFGRREEIALKVVTDRYEVPRRGGDFKLVPLQVGNGGINFQMLVGGAIPQYANGAGGAVDGRNSPAVLGEPKSVAARATGKVEGSSGEELFGGFDQEARWSGLEVFGGTFFRAIAFFPSADFHEEIVAGLARICKARPDQPS